MQNMYMNFMTSNDYGVTNLLLYPTVHARVNGNTGYCTIRHSKWIAGQGHRLHYYSNNLRAFHQYSIPCSTCAVGKQLSVDLSQTRAENFGQTAAQLQYLVTSAGRLRRCTKQGCQYSTMIAEIVSLTHAIITRARMPPKRVQFERLIEQAGKFPRG